MTAKQRIEKMAKIHQLLRNLDEEGIDTVLLTCHRENYRMGETETISEDTSKTSLRLIRGGAAI